MNDESDTRAVVIREAAAGDFTRVAELISATQPEPVTAADLLEWERRSLAGQIRRRFVGTDATGRIASYGVAQHTTAMGEGRFYLWATVDAACRRRSLGAQIYDAALNFALAYGAVELESEVREDDDAGLRFATRRGYQVVRHIFESAIDLGTFDDAPFDGLLEDVQAGGVRFLSLADVAMDPGYFRQLYEVNYRAVEDDPGATGGYVSFADFQQILFSASWFDPAGQIMAIDAASGAVIGLAAVGFFQHTNRAYNMITGVDRPYRGRKVAQALKLLTIRYAKARGYSSIVTNNDSQNAAMLAINRRLGYVPRPGIYKLAKALV